MTDFTRFALYAMAPAPLHNEASAWLGWDCRTGEHIPYPDLSGLPDAPDVLTSAPSKYGFHATMKAPFRLADGLEISDLRAACAQICASLSGPVRFPIKIAAFKGFVALVPEAHSQLLQDLAADLVQRFDDFRAPLNENEVAKRRQSGLTPRQEALLQAWGYPYVMEEFQFHMTLTGRRTEPESEAIAAALARHFKPVIPDPLEIDSIALLGEAKNGYFHVIDEYPLAAAGP